MRSTGFGKKQKRGKNLVLLCSFYAFLVEVMDNFKAKDEANPGNFLYDLNAKTIKH